MGKLFQTQIDNFQKKRCRNCNVDLYLDFNDLIVETTKGTCKAVFGQYVHNVIIVPDINKLSYLYMNNSIFMFDDDVCLQNEYNKPTLSVYCKCCNLFLGWKYDSMYCLFN